MSSYAGRHAELYDLFYAGKPYAAEAAFVSDCLTRAGVTAPARLLELACGTGTHALHLARTGYQVTATDYSAAMLAVARHKAAAQQLPIDVLEVDMRKLDELPGAYDAVVCLFDSIGYVQTDAALAEVFAGVHARLAPGGVFVFEFWHAPAMLNGYEPVRVRRFNEPGRCVLRISETTLQRDTSLASVAYDIYDLRDDNTYDRIVETQVNRYFTVPELAAWAVRYGFSPRAFHAGFTRDAAVTDDTWHVVAVWSKS